MGKIHLLFLSALLFGCASAPETYELEIYYDGFWTNHRVAKDIDKLKDEHRISLFESRNNLSNHEHSAFFSGFKTRDNEHIPDDLIIYVLSRDETGSIVHELVGDRQHLYDIRENRIKELNDIDKNILRCFFVKNGRIKADMSRDIDFCSNSK